MRLLTVQICLIDRADDSEVNHDQLCRAIEDLARDVLGGAFVTDWKVAPAKVVVNTDASD